MDSTAAATLVALTVNVAALLVVGYQTLLTRRSLRVTRESLELTRESLGATQESMDAAKRSTEMAVRTMHIQLLPSAGWIIRAQTDLRMWLEDLEGTAQRMLTAGAVRDAARIQAIANAGLPGPKGLIGRHAIEHAPDWLATIWTAGAQYYYDAKAPQRDLWNAGDDSARYDFITDLVERFDDSSRGIRELLLMIDDLVPDAYLHSPASVSDERFLD